MEWTQEDDLLLAETILRHIREGSTQLQAFEEVGNKLNCTSASCGFRWNSVVRHQYTVATQLAKKQRVERKKGSVDLSNPLERLRSEVINRLADYEQTDQEHVNSILQYDKKLRQVEEKREKLLVHIEEAKKELKEIDDYIEWKNTK